MCEITTIEELIDAVSRYTFYNVNGKKVSVCDYIDFYKIDYSTDTVDIENYRADILFNNSLIFEAQPFDSKEALQILENFPWSFDLQEALKIAKDRGYEATDTDLDFAKLVGLYVTHELEDYYFLEADDSVLYFIKAYKEYLEAQNK